MKVSSTLHTSIDRSVLTLTMNRPEVYNALNEEMKKALNETFKEASKDPSVRSIVLRGAGTKAFCSGQDLKADPPGSRSLKESLEQSYNPLILRIRTIEKPVIAMINGVAAGAGCSLALACDMRVMATTAKLVEVFARIGLVPDSGSHWFLHHLVGPARAFEYAATGRDIDAEEANRVGLVNSIAPPEQLEAQTLALAHSLAEGPTRAIGLMKRVFHKAATSNLEDLLAYEAQIQDIASGTTDYHEGVRAFLEKRKARFTGR
jgi:2-(1,2-epoxy-1,2-dihydrophenyl)acetyl-CoA isomerase